jgi:hypothetical protein
VTPRSSTQPTAQERDQDGIRHRVRDAEVACVDRFHGEQSAVPDAAGVEPKVPVLAWPRAVGQSSAGTRTLSVADAARQAGTSYEQEGIMRTDDGSQHIRSADQGAMRVGSDHE